MADSPKRTTFYEESWEELFTLSMMGNGWHIYVLYFLPFRYVLLAMVCGPVGVEDPKRIPDKRITASTHFSRYYHPFYGRLNGKRGSHHVWCSKNKHRTDYLQVDLSSVQVICAVATQGATDSSMRVTSYKLKLSFDGSTYNFYMEDNAVKVNE